MPAAVSHLSIYLSVYLSIYLFVCLSFCLSVSLSVHQLISQHRCRPLAVDEKELERLIQSYGCQLTDYDRFKGQMFRVARDILAHRHLLTICDVDRSDTTIYDNSNSRLVAATVEAFIKCIHVYLYVKCVVICISVCIECVCVCVCVRARVLL